MRGVWMEKGQHACQSVGAAQSTEVAVKFSLEEERGVKMVPC